MRLSHGFSAVSYGFDDPNLVSSAGLVPVMGLAERAGLSRLAGQLLTVPGPAGANAGAKVASIVAGMCAGADSIDDLDLLRHGGMPILFDQVRAPSTLGTFLRAFHWGNVRQLDALARRFTAELSRHARLLPGAETIAFLDMDSTMKEVFGHAKQGAGYGYNGVRGLHPLLATVCTPLAAPVVCGTRLRGGRRSALAGASGFVAEAIGTAKAAGATGRVIVRADSAFYAGAVVAACHRLGAQVSVTARLTASVRRAIEGIPEDAWTAIRYPNAIFDKEQDIWISDAQIAEVAYTAFGGTRQVTDGRLIVRRVRRLNRKHPQGQEELFPAYRYHAVFATHDLVLEQAEAFHRDHAIIEQVIAELKASALAHLPSGVFTANAAWLTCAAVTYNLTHAAGVLAGAGHARARTATIRRTLITIPARIARSARRLRLHLPRDWPWEAGWATLFDAVANPAPG